MGVQREKHREKCILCSSDKGLANGSTKEKHRETFSFRVTWAWLMGVQRKNMRKLLACK